VGAGQDALTNLTITVPTDVLRRARIRALHEDDSVNAYLRRCLEHYVDEQEDMAATVARLREIMDMGEVHMGGWQFSREEIYERD
jgi:hypothetical protein